LIAEIKTRQTVSRRNYGEYISCLKVDGKKLYSLPYGPDSSKKLLEIFFERHGRGKRWRVSLKKMTPTRQVYEINPAE
jgi:hypothetical protein